MIWNSLWSVHYCNNRRILSIDTSSRFCLQVCTEPYGDIGGNYCSAHVLLQKCLGSAQHPQKSWEAQEKNLWRRKCVRRAIFQNIEVWVEVDEALFNPYFVYNTSYCVTVRPVRCHLTPKMNIAFFHQKFNDEYFFIPQFFRKKLYFQRNCKKLFWGAFDNFLGKEGVLRRKLT